MMPQLNARDRNLIWHPFTQEKTADLPIAIQRGKGAYLYDEHGKAYLDLISSWWVNLHGHAHPVIAEAIYKQAKTLEHVIFAGFTHEPAVMLCEKLQSMLPETLARFFFSDNGSTAVEAALKMAYQYWWNQGIRNRTKFLSFEGGYHGDTFGAMSVGKGSGFHEPFQKLFFEVNTIPFPATWDGDLHVEEKEEASLQKLEELLEKEHEQIAALIGEPLIQGAGGMRFCRAEYLKRVFDLVKSYKILVIFDEVMTGFGRTGTFFAFQQIERTPDFLCLSKGLSGGFMPLALTITTQEIYDAFLGERFDSAFAHGHSYTANPLGCAAALASLDVLNDPKTMQNIHRIHQTHQALVLNLIHSCLHIQAPRTLGVIAAWNLEDEQSNYAYSKVGALKKMFLQEGLLIRPLGNCIYILPPYCITEAELQDAYERIKKILQKS